jgi:hypothetical protein
MSQKSDAQLICKNSVQPRRNPGGNALPRATKRSAAEKAAIRHSSDK